VFILPIKIIIIIIIIIMFFIIIIQVIKSRRIGWAGHVACMGDRRGVCRVLVGKPEGKKLLGKHRRR
jgi:hypothetical protein